MGNICNCENEENQEIKCHNKTQFMKCISDYLDMFKKERAIIDMERTENRNEGFFKDTFKLNVKNKI
jgi:3-hydroxymyristoyl/3-hydroxydecanoyl-(acyl carrier protein) dehydratase